MAGRNRLVRNNSRISGTMQSGIDRKQIDPGILLDMKNEIEEKIEILEDLMKIHELEDERLIITKSIEKEYDIDVIVWNDYIE